MAHEADEDANAKMKALTCAVIGTLVAFGGMVPTASSAAADCGGGTSSDVEVSGDLNGILAQGNEAQDASSCGGSPGSDGPAGPTDLVGYGLDTLCVTTAMELGENPIAYCGLDEDGELPALTPGMVAAAFKTIPLPPSNLIVQPPNGRTLVNFETNFYTDNRPFDIEPFGLLRHTIEIRVRPVTFTWNYGDGSVESTESPGAAYPDLEITHTYLSKGTVGPSVDTTYAATYRVDGQGPWRDVDGTVTIAGAPASLEVLTATPVLVGYDG